jgi:hypothetical protein
VGENEAVNNMAYREIEKSDLLSIARTSVKKFICFLNIHSLSIEFAGESYTHTPGSAGHGMPVDHLVFFVSQVPPFASQLCFNSPQFLFQAQAEILKMVRLLSLCD